VCDRNSDDGIENENISDEEENDRAHSRFNIQAAVTSKEGLHFAYKSGGPTTALEEK